MWINATTASKVGVTCGLTLREVVGVDQRYDYKVRVTCGSTLREVVVVG